MGLPQGVGLTDLVAIDAVGLQKVIQQILDHLHDQEHSLNSQTRRLREMELQMGKLTAEGEVAEHEDAHNEVDAGTLAQGSDTARAELERRVEILERRADCLEEDASAFTSRTGSLETCAEELQRHVADELSMLGARVRQAEAKASDARRESKSYRELGEETAAALDRLERKIQIQEESSPSPFRRMRSLKSEDHPESSHMEAAVEEVQRSVQELRQNLRFKASEAVVDAMRVDLEQNQKVLHDAVYTLGRRLNRQEERESQSRRPSRRPSEAPSEGRGRMGAGSSSAAGACREEAPEATEDDSHCLLCSRARSPSPGAGLMGSDGNIYAHAAEMLQQPAISLAVHGSDRTYIPSRDLATTAESINLSPTNAQSTGSGQSIRSLMLLRAKPTPPSIPTVQVPSQPWAVKGAEGTSAATTSTAPRGSRQRKDGGSLVQMETAQRWSASRLSRPSSANRTTRSVGSRPASAQRAATPGSRDGQPLNSYLSLPSFDKMDHGDNMP